MRRVSDIDIFSTSIINSYLPQPDEVPVTCIYYACAKQRELKQHGYFVEFKYNQAFKQELFGAEGKCRQDFWGRVLK